MAHVGYYFSDRISPYFRRYLAAHSVRVLILEPKNKIPKGSTSRFRRALLTSRSYSPKSKTVSFSKCCSSLDLPGIVLPHNNPNLLGGLPEGICIFHPKCIFSPSKLTPDAVAFSRHKGKKTKPRYALPSRDFHLPFSPQTVVHMFNLLPPPPTTKQKNETMAMMTKNKTMRTSGWTLTPRDRPPALRSQHDVYPSTS